MPSNPRTARFLALLVLFLLSACPGGRGSHDVSGGPSTNIDLTVTDFRISPSAADPEDTVTLEGTIQNQGTETANPMQGDSFRVRFNLSRDGTFELNEIGFLETVITDPIPGGGSHNFSFPATLGGGDTLSTFGSFCTSLECDPPETGVVGIKVDSIGSIKEIRESNNFKFIPFQVVGTQVLATFTGCNFGIQGNPGDPGCDLSVSDGIDTVALHRPCTTCNANDTIFFNDLHSTVFASVILRGCTLNGAPNGGFCAGSWLLTATTPKPGLPASIQQLALPCNAFYGDGPNHACSATFFIRDVNY